MENTLYNWMLKNNKMLKSLTKQSLTKKSLLCAALTSFAFPAYAFQCSIFEGDSSDIPSFKTEIAELKNLDKQGRHIKVIVPKVGPVQEFDLELYIKGLTSTAEIKNKLSQVAGGTVVYIDLYPVEKRYEIRMGRLTTNLSRVIAPTVYANFAYNKEHNEVYDLQGKIAVFCNQ